MKKYTVFAILLIFALFPPLAKEGTISMPSNVWAWILLFFGIIAIFFLNSSKLNICIKILGLYLYIACFFSQLPHVSFFCYFNVLLCISFYLLCRYLKKEELEFQLNLFPALLLLQFIFLTVQTLNKDAIFNSLDTHHIKFGTIGNTSMLGCFLITIGGILCMKNKWYIVPLIILVILSKSMFALAALWVGLCFYLFFKTKKKSLPAILLLLCIPFMATYHWGASEKIRLKVWQRGIEMVMFDRTSATEKKFNLTRSLKGWGMGTWKYLYPLNSEGLDYYWGETNKETGVYEMHEWTIGKHKGDWLMWVRAHNDYLQAYFELGFVGLLLMLGFIGTIIIGFIRAQKTEIFIISTAGLIAIAINMIGMFPTKMIQAVPIIIFSIAYNRFLAKKAYE